MRFSLKQSTRVILLFIDIGLLTIFSRLAFDSWVPPVGNEGFWFYAALLSLLLGSRLITPFYNKPVDVIAYAVAAVIALFVVNDWTVWSPDERMLFAGVTGFCGFAAAASVSKTVLGIKYRCGKDHFLFDSDVVYLHSVDQG